MSKTWSTPKYAITKEEHDALCADRDRPLTQTPMTNGLAAQTRAMASLVDDRANHNGLEQLIADRQRRQTNLKPVREPPVCGTIPGYGAHMRAKQTPCEPCRTVYNTNKRDTYKKKAQ